MRNDDTFKVNIVYEFKLFFGGGIGDLIKYFMYALSLCIKNKFRLYYNVNNIPIEKYLKLKYQKMYKSNTNTINYICKTSNEMFLNDINYEYYYITPGLFYNEVGNNYNFGISPSEVFEFSDSVKLNAKNYISNYISQIIVLYHQF